MPQFKPKKHRPTLPILRQAPSRETIDMLRFHDLSQDDQASRLQLHEIVEVSPVQPLISKDQADHRRLSSYFSQALFPPVQAVEVKEPVRQQPKPRPRRLKKSSSQIVQPSLDVNSISLQLPTPEEAQPSEESSRDHYMSKTSKTIAKVKQMRIIQQIQSNNVAPSAKLRQRLKQKMSLKELNALDLHLAMNQVKQAEFSESLFITTGLPPRRSSTAKSNLESPEPLEGLQFEKKRTAFVEVENIDRPDHCSKQTKPDIESTLRRSSKALAPPEDYPAAFQTVLSSRPDDISEAFATLISDRAGKKLETNSAFPSSPRSAQSERKRSRKRLANSKIIRKLKAMNDQKLVISHKDPRKERWDIAIMVLAGVNSIMVPLELAFDLLPLFKSTLYTILNVVIDFCFLADMIVMANTDYLNRKGQLERQRKNIIRRYVKSFRFWTDSLAVVGSTFVTFFFPSLHLFGLFKIARIFRLGFLLARSNKSQDKKVFYILIKLMIYLLIYIHTVGCLWWFTIKRNLGRLEDGFDYSWISPTDYLNYKASPLGKMSNWETYLMALYHSVLMIGFNEMGPVNDDEMGFAALSMLMASFFNAQIFSEMAMMISKIQRSQMAYQSKLDGANAVIDSLGLPQDFAEAILEYFQMTLIRRQSQEDYDEFLEQLKPSLKVLIQNKMFEIQIKKNPCIQIMTKKDAKAEQSLLKSISRVSKRFLTSSHPLGATGSSNKELKEKVEGLFFLNRLVSSLGTLLTQPEEAIIEQGEKGRDLFFVSKGDCALKLVDKNGREQLSETLLTEGDHFGEIALIYKCKRTATIVARNYNTLARLSYDMYRQLVNEHPEYHTYLKMYLFTYKEDRKSFFFQMLASISYFKGHLTTDLIHDLFYSMEVLKFESGTMLLREGDPVDAVFFLEFGEVEVFTEFEQHEFVIDRLFQGSVINAKNFMTLDRMAVSLRCSENTQVMKLSDSVFSQIRSRHSKNFTDFLDITQHAILARETKFPLDYQMSIPRCRVPRAESFENYSRFMDRRHRLKTVVLRIITEVREKKKRPNIGQLIKLFKGDQGDSADKEKMIEKIKRFYEIHQEMYSKHFTQDVRFEHFTETLHRIISIQAVCDSTLVQIHNRMDMLKKRRDRREVNLLQLKEKAYNEIESSYRVVEQIRDLKKTRGHTRSKALLGCERLRLLRSQRELVDEQCVDDCKDEEFENTKERKALTSAAFQKKMAKDITPITNKYKILEHLSRKHADDEEGLEPFNSPLIAWDLAMFRRKKRKELKRRLASQESIRLESHGQVLRPEDITVEEIEEDDEDDEEEDSPRLTQAFKMEKEDTVSVSSDERSISAEFESVYQSVQKEIRLREQLQERIEPYRLFYAHTLTLQ